MSAWVWLSALGVALAVFLLTYALANTAERKEQVVTLVKAKEAKASRKEQMIVRLSVAQLSITPTEWTFLWCVSGFVVGIIGWAFGGIGLGIIGIGTGPLIASSWLRWKVSHSRKMFEEDLVEVLQHVAGSVEAGMSLSAALEVVSNDGREPMVSELRLILSKARLGLPLEDGFAQGADRMSSQDFTWIALAVRIQKEVGGNLAGILKATAETMKERFYLKRQIKTLSAEGKLSAYILMGLPILMFLYMFTTRRSYLAPLWTTTIGLMMSTSAVVMMLFGAWWMRQTVRIES